MSTPAAAFLGAPLTAGYAPRVLGPVYSVNTQRPPFRLNILDQVLLDPQVQFGLRAVYSPLTKAQITVQAKNPRIKAFVEHTFKQIWTKSLVQLSRYIEYGHLGGEVIYKSDDAGLIHFDSVRESHPLDSDPLILDHRLVGVRIKNVPGGEVRLGHPRMLWLVNRPQHGSFYGQARLEPAWVPWMEKNGRAGALDQRRLHFFKNASRGDVIYFPIGMTNMGSDDVPDNRANQDIATQLVEQLMSGGTAAIPGDRDEKGNRKWELQPPTVSGQPSGMLDYVKDIDIEILKALNVPPEVLQASGESGSGYAGRAIPAQVFYDSEDEIVNTIVTTCDQQIVRWLVRVNFGKGEDYTVEAASLAPANPQGGAPGQGGLSPGGDGGGGRYGQPGLIPYTGPRGGHGMQNPSTGRVRYDAQMSLADEVAKRVKREANRLYPKLRRGKNGWARMSQAGGDELAKLPRKVRYAILLAMLDAQGEAHDRGDPAGAHSELEALADLAHGHANYPALMAKLKGVQMSAGWTDAGMTTSGKHRWILERPGLGPKEFRYQDTMPGTWRQGRDRANPDETAAHQLAGTVRKSVDATPQQLGHFSEHLPALGVDTLRDMRMELGSVFANQRAREDLVGHIRQHVANLIEHAEPPAEPAEQAAPVEPPQTPQQGQSHIPPVPKPGKVYNVPTQDLKVDPARFQFKLNVNKAGVTSELAQVKKWNPDFAGVLAVWRDPQDGHTYVVNGHHRAELAARLGVPDVPVRYLDAPDAKSARALGALINIAEGRGTPIDAAKFLRDMNLAPESMHEKYGVSLKGALARDAAVLTKLSDPLFDRLTRGQLDQDRALAIAANLKPEMQGDLLQWLEKREEKTGKEYGPKIVAEFARQMHAAPTTKKTEEGLFGTDEKEESLFAARGELAAGLRGELAKEANDWKAVASERRAEKVGAAGNVLDVAGNKERADAAHATREVYDQLAHSKGGIADALNQYAGEYANARTHAERSAVRNKALAAVRQAAAGEIAGRPAADADRTESPLVRSGASDASPSGDAGRRDSEPAGVAIEHSKGLSPDEAKIEEDTQREAHANYAKFRDQYLEHNAVKKPDGSLMAVVLNTDEWRSMFPQYNGTNAQAVHEASSWLNKTLYKEALESQKGKGNNTLMVLAGGGGSGKGTAVSDFFPQEDYPLVLDQVSDNLAKLESKLDEAKAAGYTPHYVFVDRPPEAAWGGVVGRAVNLKKKGQLPRTVRIDIALNANLGARKVALELLKKRHDVEPNIIDNTKGDGFRRLLKDRGEAIKYLEGRIAEDESVLNSGLENRLAEEVIRQLRRGEISQEMAHGLLGQQRFQELSDRMVGGAENERPESVSAEHAAGPESEGPAFDRRDQSGRSGAADSAGQDAEQSATGGAEGTPRETAPVGSEDADYSGEFVKVGAGEVGYIGGYPVRRVGRNQFRLETTRHHVTGSPDEVADRIRRNWADERPERKNVAAALERAGQYAEPNVFTDPAGSDRDEQAKKSLPKGTRAVSLDPHTRGRVGTVEGGKLVLDGSPDVKASDFEPLDTKRSWRAGERGANETRPAKSETKALFGETPSESGYVEQAMRNLRKTSRTAGGVVDTSASAGKAEKMAEGLTGDQAAKHANANFETAIKAAHGLATDKSAEWDRQSVLHEADDLNRTINKGIVKDGVLERTDDSAKFPYTEVSKLPLARKLFADELAERLNDPNADPIETAAWIEWRANLTDHFWADGVGKTSKALAAIPLIRAGLPLPEYRDNKEFFAHSARERVNPEDGPEAYLGEPYKKFVDYYRTLMPGAEQRTKDETQAAEGASEDTQQAAEVPEAKAAPSVDPKIIERSIVRGGSAVGFDAKGNTITVEYMPGSKAWSVATVTESGAHVDRKNLATKAQAAEHAAGMIDPEQTKKLAWWRVKHWFPEQAETAPEPIGDRLREVGRAELARMEKRHAQLRGIWDRVSKAGMGQWSKGEGYKITRTGKPEAPFAAVIDGEEMTGTKAEVQEAIEHLIESYAEPEEAATPAEAAKPVEQSTGLENFTTTELEEMEFKGKRNTSRLASQELQKRKEAEQASATERPAEQSAKSAVTRVAEEYADKHSGSFGPATPEDEAGELNPYREGTDAHEEFTKAYVARVKSQRGGGFVSELNKERTPEVEAPKPVEEMSDGRPTNVEQKTEHTERTAEQSKQPWEMTKEEYAQQTAADDAEIQTREPRHMPYSREESDDLHRREIAEAVRKGRSVPPEVLDEYPDLKKAAESSVSDAPHLQLADALADKLKSGTITAADLWESANKAYGGTRADGKYGPSDAYDALETGFNKSLVDQTDPTAELDQAVEQAKELADKVSKLPTQTNRSGKKESFQQFSTPPHYAYAVSWLANLTPGETVLEPSAGTGCLAVQAANAGADVHVNELDANRAAFLEHLFGSDKVHVENAEQIAGILPKRGVAPTAIIMNPPFSQTAGRMGDKKVVMTGAKHIAEALQLLAPGGRLVAIVGGGNGTTSFGMSPEARAYKPWFDKMKEQYTIRANVGVDGDEYKKYGTSFGTRVLIFDKVGPHQGETVVGDVDDIPALMTKLAGVRNDRHRLAEGAPDEPVRGEVPGGAEGAADGLSSDAAGRADDRVSEESAEGGQRVSGSAGGPAGLRGNAGDGEPSGGGVDAGRGLRGAATGSGGTAGGAGAAESSGQPSGPDASATAGAANSTSRRKGSRGKSLLSPTVTPPDVRVAEPVNITPLATPVGVKTDGGADSLYDEYKPSRMTVAGSQKHTTKLVESAAMSSVPAPIPTYRPMLSPDLIAGGKLTTIKQPDGTIETREIGLSEAGLEFVTYAGQAHGQWVEQGDKPAIRKGMFNGDGTGTGKGRQCGAVMLDAWNQGQRKHVWISKNDKLFDDAQRDWTDIGMNPNQMFHGSELFKGGKTPDEGILYCPYSLLRSGPKDQTAQRNVEKLIDWLGPDFDGVIAFDEAHYMGNADDTKGARGTVKASQQALAGIKLQKAFPKAKIVYLSATGATKVENLAYAERLGLWGPGTAFADKAQFMGEMNRGGVAAMEAVAQSLKARGQYVARSISYDGVETDRISHTLSDEQKYLYNEMADGWQKVLENIDKAIEHLAGGEQEARRAAGVRMAATSQFWSAQQGFFNQVITAMKVPTLIERIESDLKEGRAPVVSLVNTLEAATNRALADREEGEELEELDISPKQSLINFLTNSFPVYRLEEQTDDEGKNPRFVVATDSAGNPIEDPEAVRIRDEMIARAHDLRIPQSPLDQIINHFGHENVSECTGRTKRLVKKLDENGKLKLMEERRDAKKANSQQAKDFQNGKTKIMVFSAAGGTGASYHADKNAKNQARRAFYMLQPGWRADEAMQAFGRVHRTNQVSAPLIHLVEASEIPGERRFLSTIARRLSQLGALTRGQAKTGGGGIFNENDNLESAEATEGLEAFFGALRKNMIPGMDYGTVMKQLGFNLEDKSGNRGRKAVEPPGMKQFLNRILSMRLDAQQELFGHLAHYIDAKTAQAETLGTRNTGVENFKADKVEQANSQTVYRDPNTGSEAKLFEANVTRKKDVRPWATTQQGKKPVAYARNRRSGRVWAVYESAPTTDSKGNVQAMYALKGPTGAPQFVNTWSVASHAGTNYETIAADEAEQLWNAEVEAAPKTENSKEYFITGDMLAVWDKLPKDRPKIFRVKVDKGQSIVGRHIPEALVEATLDKLGVNREGEEAAAHDPADAHRRISTQGAKATLANDWTIKRVKVGYEPRIEIIGPIGMHKRELENNGVFVEKVAGKERYFVPTGPDGAKVLERVIKTRNAPIRKIEETD